MATGNITLRWNDLNGASTSRLIPNLNLDTNRPIDLIVQHGESHRPLQGKIWKMRRSNLPGGQLNLWEPFSAPSNGIGGNADLYLEQV